MDALGVPPGFAKAVRPRRAPDLLAVYSDILAFWDVFAGLCLGLLSLFLCVRCGFLVAEGDASLGVLAREVALGSIIAALILREPGLAVGFDAYAPRRLLLRMTWRAAAASGILVTVGLLTRGFNDRGRLWLITWCGLFFLSACLSRGILLGHLFRLARHGGLREAVAVIGAPDVAGRLAARLAENASVVRVIDDPDDIDLDAPMPEAMAELLELARAGGVDTIVVALRADDARDATSILHHLQAATVQITTCSAIDAGTDGRATRRMLGNVPLSVVADRPLKRWDLFAKLLLDKAGGFILLLLAAPVMLLIALVIGCESPGPIIFRQRRSGWGGRLFTIYKFRTMRHDPAQTSRRQTDRDDDRLTRVGGFLRRTSLDELPQLWNVLRGDMSLVGPRPHADVLHATERVGCTIVAEYAQRQRMKPGLTGWAQIHGSRGAVKSAEALRRRVTLDLHYIDHWSFWLDIAILGQTPLAILMGKNAF